MNHSGQNSHERLRRAISSARHPGPPVHDRFQPTSVMALFSFTPDTELLFIQKADTEGYPWANQMAFPGGHHDLQDGTRLETALRELHEETGIQRTHVDVIGSLGHFQTINNRDIEAFTGIWGRQETIRHDPQEISRVFHVPLKHLIATHLSRAYTAQPPDVYTLTYPVEDVVIWGVTAKIVYHLIQILISD